MNNYRYKAISEEGRYVSGKMSAETPAELATLLRNNDLELISFKLEKPSSQGVFNKIKSKDLISIFVHLEQLEKAGVSIIDSISDLRDNADSARIRNLMQEVHQSIENGSLFSESLAKHPHVFSPTYVGLVAMGEKTGNLANSFSSIIDDIKWNMDMRRKTTKATTGPLFGLFLMFIVMGIMTTIVVPKVTGFLAMQDIALPVSTIALIKFSSFIQNYWLVIILFFPAMWLLIKFLQRYHEIAVKIDDLKLKIPIIGPIMNKMDAAKFCQFFSMTFKSGLGVLECLEASGSVVKNRAMRRSIEEIKHQVSDGHSLSKSIAQTGYFPNLVSRMFKIGEESGNMENALTNIKFFYDREINDSIDRLVSMIQPTITMMMGGMIAWITIAVFGPIYGTFSKIH